jgi:hypothetical protein
VSFWAYPRLRSFGLSHQNAKQVLCSQIVPEIVYKKNIEWVTNYHRDMVLNNRLTIDPKSNLTWAYPLSENGEHRNSWSKLKF